MKKGIFIAMVSLLGILFLGGCGLTATSSEKVQDLEYTVVKEDEIPQELLAAIEKQKENYFKLTYQDGEYLYIASGYGAQNTGGYSIQVKDLYLTTNAIYFDTELFGPQKGETVHEAVTYPYIVVKTESRQEPVVFE